jgi:hypothetical protein
MSGIRLYFSDLSIVEKLDFQHMHLLQKTEFTRIFSSEGMFHVKENKLMREQIQDQPIENITIQNIDFIMDKSSIKYDVDWYQLNPYHIAETIDVYTYALPTHALPTHALPTHALPTHALPTHALPTHAVTLILEKQDKHLNSIYFYAETDDFYNSIGTFLSGLNLC